MCEFTECYACSGDGHIEGDITIDCGYCYGTGQMRITDEYGHDEAIQPERDTEPPERRKAA